MEPNKGCFLTVTLVLDGDCVNRDHGNAVVELHVILLISPHLVVNKGNFVPVGSV
jgi:hypothetical protein